MPEPNTRRRLVWQALLALVLALSLMSCCPAPAGAVDIPTGFSAMVKHPTMSGAEIEAAQQRCFEEDYQRLGPSIYRSIETWLQVQSFICGRNE